MLTTKVPGGAATSTQAPVRGVADLQPARAGLGTQDGERAVVGVRAGPLLAGERAGGRGRVVERAEGGDGVAQVGVEAVLGEVERGGHRAHDAGGEVLQRGVVGHPGLAEAGEVGPGRRRVAEGVGVGVGDALGPRQGAAVEGFLEVGGRVLALGPGQRLAVGAEPAVGVAGPRGDAGLGLGVLGEEGLRRLPDAVDGGLGHAVAGEDEEARVAADAVEVGGAGRARSAPGGGLEGGEVEGADEGGGSWVSGSGRSRQPWLGAKPSEALGLVVAVEGLVARPGAALRDALVEAVDHLGRGEAHGGVVVRDVEDLVAEAVGPRGSGPPCGPRSRASM